MTRVGPLSTLYAMPNTDLPPGLLAAPRSLCSAVLARVEQLGTADWYKLEQQAEFDFLHSECHCRIKVASGAFAVTVTRQCPAVTKPAGVMLLGHCVLGWEHGALRLAPLPLGHGPAQAVYTRSAGAQRGVRVHGSTELELTRGPEEAPGVHSPSCLRALRCPGLTWRAQAIFEKRRLTSHCPYLPTMFPFMPRTYGKALQKIKQQTSYTIAEMTPIMRVLVPLEANLCK
eukprot:3939465-Rhodomonas_salina.2